MGRFTGAMVLVTVFLESIESFADKSHGPVLGVTGSAVQDSTSHGISDKEYNALYALYDATNGLHWNSRGFGGDLNWNFTAVADPCRDKWDGVACGEASDGSLFVAELNLGDCGLGGSLPVAISDLSGLRTLNLSLNELTGTLPSEVGDMAMLTKLHLYANSLKGSIPSSLGGLENLEQLILFENGFSQTLPLSLSGLSNLQAFDLFGNRLTGTLPSSYGLLAKLVFFDVGFNKLEGTVPDVWEGVAGLTYVHINNNDFIGTVPPSFGTLKNLSTLHLSDNYFSGTLPSQLSTMRNLRYVLVEKNFLEGSLSSLFNASVQHKLDTVLVTGNRFTGSIPADLFRIPSVRAIYCDNNCFTGALPTSICDNPFLRELSLNGLHTSKACRTPLIVGRRNIYSLLEPLEGGVPPCVFSLPVLEVLDLSSNGLYGTLPGNATLSPTLSTLSIAHNHLNGTLPHQFQKKSWIYLDVSFNRLTGTLTSEFAVQSDVTVTHLDSNRFSGWVPHSLLNASNIEMLAGNLFTCEFDKSDLPAEDPTRTTYQCASLTFVQACATWLIVAVALLIVIVCIYADKKSYNSLLQVYAGLLNKIRADLDVRDLKSSAGEYVPRLRRYKKITDICRLCIAVSCLGALLILVVLLPLYSVLSAYYGTYQYQYAYNVSLIYLSGTVPAALCITALLLLLLSIYFWFVLCLRKYQQRCSAFEREIGYEVAQDEHRARESAHVQEDWFTREKVTVYVGCILVDLVVVFGVNVAYIQALVHADDVQVYLLQAVLSAFKIAWSSFCGYAVNYLTMQSRFKSRNLKKGLLFVMVLVTIFNNIVVPCLTVLAASPTCFYHILEPSRSISSQAVVEDCLGYTDQQCKQHPYVIGGTTVKFDPPFIYSYQCAASFVTYYAPAFMFMCILTGFVVPAFRYAVSVGAPYLKEGHFWHRMFYPRMAKVLYPVSSESPVAKRYFSSRKLIVALLNNLGVLLTFGAVFPPLAAALFVASLTRVYFSRMETKRFLRRAAELGRKDLIDRIDADCAFVGSETMLIRSMWLLIVVSCWFYALFLFDTLGDAVGFSRAYWVLIVMLVLPVLAYTLFRLYSGTSFVRRRDLLLSTLSAHSAAAMELALKFQPAATLEVRSPMTVPDVKTAEAEEA
jgi:Leucine-rich repeat (LRR) protein